MKKNILLISAICGLGLATFAQTFSLTNVAGEGVQYNNFGGTFATPVGADSAVGVLKLTHRGHLVGGLTSLQPPYYYSSENLILDWLPGLDNGNRYSQIVFKDGDLGEKQSSLFSYGADYIGIDLQNKIGFKSHLLEGQTFFFDNYQVGINTIEVPTGHSLGVTEGIAVHSVRRIPDDPNTENCDITFFREGSNTTRDWVIRSTGSSHTSSPRTLQFWSPDAWSQAHVHFANTSSEKPIKVGIGVGYGDTHWDMKGLGYQLYVKTGILTEKLKVATLGTTDWSDYVFDEDYELLSIKKVEKFIDKHHHLPNVPSAAEVEKNGIDVVEMDATLLRKIEELTLYMIELKKENDSIRKELKKLSR